jgi:hypothetical protein
VAPFPHRSPPTGFPDQQHEVVWNLPAQGDPEGPSFIDHGTLEANIATTYVIDINLDSRRTSSELMGLWASDLRRRVG